MSTNNNKKSSWIITFHSRRGHFKESWNEDTNTVEEYNALVESASNYRKKNGWGNFRMKRK